jgi:hypothetical protein
MLLLPPHSRFI